MYMYMYTYTVESGTDEQKHMMIYDKLGFLLALANNKLR